MIKVGMPRGGSLVHKATRPFRVPEVHLIIGMLAVGLMVGVGVFARMVGASDIAPVVFFAVSALMLYRALLNWTHTITLAATTAFSYALLRPLAWGSVPMTTAYWLLGGFVGAYLLWFAVDTVAKHLRRT